MEKDTRILKTVLRLVGNMEADWTPELEKLNISDQLFDLYNLAKDHRTGNTMFAFIVLSYDASSDYLETTKDRIENKRSIFIKLAGPSFATNELYLDTLLGDNGGVIDKTIEWYLNQQRDWRWGNIISNMEYHAMAQSMQKTAKTIKDMQDVGRMLEIAESRREKADQYLENIHKEYIEIDDALHKEGKVKLTERLRNDYMGWELYIHQRNNRLAKEKALEAAINVAELDSEDE